MQECVCVCVCVAFFLFVKYIYIYSFKKNLSFLNQKRKRLGSQYNFEDYRSYRFVSICYIFI